jgi:hypothetical protein
MFKVRAEHKAPGIGCVKDQTIQKTRLRYHGGMQRLRKDTCILKLLVERPCLRSYLNPRQSMDDAAFRKKSTI